MQIPPAFIIFVNNFPLAMNVLSSVMLGTLKTINSDNFFFFSLLFWVVIGHLQLSSLYMFYTGNFHHTRIIQTPFMVFQYADESTEEKIGFWNFFLYNCNHQSYIVSNYHDLESISLNNNIWNFLFIGWMVKPQEASILGKFFYDHLVHIIFSMNSNLMEKKSQQNQLPIWVSVFFDKN